MKPEASVPKSDTHPLPAALAMAVPLQISQLAARGGPTDTEWAFARQWADTLAEKGDVLLYGEKKGETAKLFAEFANAVAVLAFAPGGITIFGQHFEYKEKTMERNEVYRLIDGEREYQQAIGQPDEHDTGEWLQIMDYYMDQAWNEGEDTDNDRLASIRKIVAVGVAALEQHGCPPREALASGSTP